MSMSNTAPATPAVPTTPAAQTGIAGFVHNVSIHLAGLGCLGAGVYALLFTKNATAPAVLFGLGGTYLGYVTNTLSSSES